MERPHNFHDSQDTPLPPRELMEALNIRRRSNRRTTQVKTASIVVRVFISSYLVLEASSGTRVHHWNETAQCFVPCSASQQAQVGRPVDESPAHDFPTLCLPVQHEAVQIEFIVSRTMLHTEVSLPCWPRRPHVKLATGIVYNVLSCTFSRICCLQSLVTQFPRYNLSIILKFCIPIPAVDLVRSTMASFDSSHKSHHSR